MLRAENIEEAHGTRFLTSFMSSSQQFVLFQSYVFVRIYQYACHFIASCEPHVHHPLRTLTAGR